MPEVQSLFALEPGTDRPIGVAIYMRADLEHVTVLHIGLSEEFCAGGLRDDSNLLLRFMKEIRRSSRRMKGVRRLRVLYGDARLGLDRQQLRTWLEEAGFQPGQTELYPVNQGLVVLLAEAARP